MISEVECLFFLFSDRKIKERNNKLDRLYNQHQKSMYYSAYRKSSDSQLSEDAVQQSFEKLLENPRYLDNIDESNYQATKYYLCRISINVANSMLRKNSSLTFNDNVFDFIEDNDITPLEFVLNNETKEHVIKEIKKINENYQEIITMKFSRGLSNKEIADILEITEENVRKRLERAKKSFVKKYEEEDLK